MSYHTSDAAARAVLRMINPRSVAEDFEYAGKIFRRRDGTFDFTWPRRGVPGDPTDRSNASIAGIPIPDGCVEVGMYHTHGDYAPEGRRAVVRQHLMGAASPDPSDTHIYQQRDEFGQYRRWSHSFTPSDIRTLQDRSMAHGDPGYTSYLGTPSGEFYYWRRGMLRQERLN